MTEARLEMKIARLYCSAQSCNKDSSKILEGLSKGPIIEGEGHFIMDPFSKYTRGHFAWHSEAS